MRKNPNYSKEVGKLFLIPSLISEINPLEVIPFGTKKAIENTRFYLAENAKTARAYLKKITPYIQQSSFEVVQMDKHGSESNYFSHLDRCFKGENIGLLSESGAPAVADPGSLIVGEAHRRGIEVVPLVGPSSILLALMASGLNGQNYSFAGYLPVDKHERRRKIKELEARSMKEKNTFIFIETPYRNLKLIEDLLQTMRSDSLLCIAADLTGQNQFIKTKKISDWTLDSLVFLEKVPAIFLIGSH